MGLPSSSQYQGNSPKTKEELELELKYQLVMGPPSQEFPPDEITKTLKYLNLDTTDVRPNPASNAE